VLKKVAVVFIVITLTSSFYGCQKKSTVTLTSSNTATPVPKELQNPDANSSVQATASVSANSNSQESFIVDAPAIDNTFEKNYAIALEDAQKSLLSAVKYCGAKVSFFGATLSEISKQDFIFYSDQFSKDYYWVVSLNGYQDNHKTRAFAAKKDLVGELKCMASTGRAPGSYSNAYEQLTKTSQFQKVDPGTIALTTLETMDTGWNITVTNNAGENVVVNTINPSAQNSPSTQN